MKHALTAKQSLLFADLSLIGNTRSYFKRTLQINYSLSECLICGDEMFWNYDNDSDYNKALLRKRSLNKAIKHFIHSLETTTKNLESVTAFITHSNKMTSSSKKELLFLFKKYYSAYLQVMPFLFVFWNTEHLLITQLKKDLKIIFGKKGEYILSTVLIPAHETYFAQEKKSIEKIIMYVSTSTKLRQLFLHNSVPTILNSAKNDPHFMILLDKHVRDFSFTTTALYLGEPMTKKQIIERIKSSLEDTFIKKKSELKKRKENDQKYHDQIMKNRNIHPEIKMRLKLAQELMYWKNQRLDVMFLSDFKIHTLSKILQN